MRGVRLNALLTAVTGLSIQVPFLAVLGVGGALVARGDLPVSTLVAFLLYLFYLIGPIGQLVGGDHHAAAGSRRRRADRARSTPMAVEDVPLTPVPLPRSPAPRPERWAAPGRRCRSACASSTCRSRTPAASRCSTTSTFEAPGPGLTALVGPSGAGKTTLFSLLMRFYDLDAGRVLVGGRDVAGMALRDLRRLIGYVEQDAPALEGTLLENLPTRRRGRAAPRSRTCSRAPGSTSSCAPARRARDARRHPRRPAVGR